MKTIHVIEPTIATHRPSVAAYCRVSTEKEEQETSLEAQIAHFTSRISSNHEWEFAGIYAEQKSGTRVENRSELNRLLTDCEAGHIDLILMKSISRLGRNTLDALNIFNKLIALGIEVQFELEQLSTKDERVRKMLAYLAAIAQNESWSRSEDVKMGMRRSANKGNTILNYNRFLGYTKNKAGQLVIVEDEAEIVRLIYSLYLAGNGCWKIKRYLEKNGIKTVSGKDEWSTSTIDRILSNEKYVETLITQKSYVKDFLEGKQYKNNGELEQMVFENHHDAILEMETFDVVQRRKGIPRN